VNTRRKRLTLAMLDAMSSALNSALAGDGFNGGDFDGKDEEVFAAAREWVFEERVRRGWIPLADEPPPVPEKISPEMEAAIATVEADEIRRGAFRRTPA